MIRWPAIPKPKRVETRHATSTSVLELETAKEILAEVFHARPGDVEEMILRRLEERSWIEKTEIRRRSVRKCCGQRLFNWVCSPGQEPKVHEDQAQLRL